MDLSKRSFMAGISLGGAAALAAAAGGNAMGADTTASTYDEIIKRGTLRLGVVNTEPWTFKDTSGKIDGGAMVQGNGVVWRGVGIAVANAVAEALGVKVEPLETAWGTAVAGLQSNQFDLMFALDSTPVRAKAIDFLNSQIAWSPFGLITSEDDKSENWSDYDDASKTIALVLGSGVDTFITPLLQTTKLERFQEFTQAVAAFQARRVDAIACGLEGSVLAVRLPGSKVINPKPLFAMPTGAGLRYDSDGRLKAFLESSILYLYASGQIQTAYEDFLAFRGLDPKLQTPIMRERVS